MLRFGVTYSKSRLKDSKRLLFARFATYEEALRCVHLIERRPGVHEAMVSIKEEKPTYIDRTVLIVGAVLFDLALISGLIYFYIN